MLLFTATAFLTIESSSKTVISPFFNTNNDVIEEVIPLLWDYCWRDWWLFGFCQGWQSYRWLSAIIVTQESAMRCRSEQWMQFFYNNLKFFRCDKIIARFRFFRDYQFFWLILKLKFVAAEAQPAQDFISITHCDCYATNVKTFPNYCPK